MKHATRSFSIVLVVLCGAFFTQSAFAQDDANAAQSGPDEVAVPVGTTAVDLLQRASDKQTQKQWNSAAAFHQQVLHQFADQLIPLPQDGSQVTRYLNAAAVVRDQLCDWPSEGLIIYNTLYGGRAASALMQVSAEDSVALADVFQRYPCTEAAAKAGLKLLNRTLERGDLYSACAKGCELLKMSALSDGDRAMVTCQTALASHWLEENAAADSSRLQLRQSQPKVIGLLGGREGALSELLDAAMKVPASPPLAKPSVPADARFKQFDISFEAANYAGMPPLQRTASIQADQASSDTSDIVAAADADAAFVQDGRAIYAFYVNTGKPLAGWPAEGRYSVDIPCRVQRQQLHVALTADSVLAVLGQPDTSPIPGHTLVWPGPQPATSRLVCIDRKVGCPRWTRAAADFLASAHVTGDSIICGTPLVVSATNSVLIPILQSQSNGFDNCYVVSLSLDAGMYEWSTYVGGCAGPQGRTRQINVPGVLTEFEDEVYVMTNLGTVAMIDPATGRLRWCDSYSRHGSAEPLDGPVVVRAMRNGQRAIRFWKQNPLVVCDGHVFVMPADSSQLFVLDAESGIQQASLSRELYGNADVLIGVKRNVLCLTNDHDMLMVDWTMAASNDGRSGVLWREAGFTSEADNAVSGRGVWSDDSIYIPTRNRLYQFSFRRRRIVSVCPPDDRFIGADSSGNVTLASGRVLLARPAGVTVFFGLPPIRR